MKRGDEARVTVLVEVPPDEAFRVFTEEIDQWWRRGLKYRVSGKHRGVMCLEPKLGGRLFESWTADGAEQAAATGLVTAWDPPTRLVLEWRNVNFSATEKTEVEVCFAPSPSGTEVTLVHRGWSDIRADHPARHGHDVPAFLRMMGMWWGEQLTSLRLRAGASDRALNRRD